MLCTYLGEAERVNLVLGSHLQSNAGAVLGVVCGTDTSLNGRLNLLVDGGSEDAEVVGTSDGTGERTVLVAKGQGVSGQSGLLNIVCGLTTNEETLVCEDTVDSGGDVGCATLLGRDEVTETTEVERALLEVKGELLTLGETVLGRESSEDVGLESIGKDVVELDLGGGSGGGGDGLGHGNT